MVVAYPPREQLIGGGVPLGSPFFFWFGIVVYIMRAMPTLQTSLRHFNRLVSSILRMMDRIVRKWISKCRCVFLFSSIFM